MDWSYVEKVSAVGNRGVRISVQDRGVGINAAELNQVFRAFLSQSGSGSRSNQWHGAGIIRGEANR